MHTFIIYLFQMVLCSGLLYLFYALFLKNRKTYQFNRFYLLGALLLSLLVPFIKIPYYVSLTNNSGIGMQTLVRYNALMLAEIAVPARSGALNWERILLFLIAGISLLLVAKTLFAIRNLVRMRLQNISEKKYGVTFIATPDKTAPFSFFRWLFWNPQKQQNPVTAESILQHELCHIRQLHSMDVLIAEFIAAAAWMNPFYWIMKNELKAVHEFAADDYAAKQAGNLTYTEHLITEAIFQKQLQLVNPFFNDQFKRRLAMLTQKTNSSKGRYNKWIAIPLFIATAIFFVISCQKKDVFNEQGNNSPSPSLQQTVKNPEIDARYSGDWARFLQTNLRGDVPVENGAGPGNYQVIAQFVVDVDGTVSNVKILKDPGYGMGSETVRVIAASGRWTPAMQNGKPVKAYRKQPITFQVTEG